MDNLYSCNDPSITCLSSFFPFVIGAGQKFNFVYQKKVFFDKKCFPCNTRFYKALRREAHKAWRADILNTHLRSIYFEVNRDFQRLKEMNDCSIPSLSCILEVQNGGVQFDILTSIIIISTYCPVTFLR